MGAVEHARPIKGLEGVYYEVRSPAHRLILKDGEYQLGLDKGSYSAELEDESSCIISLTTVLLEAPKPRKYRLIRRGKTYTLFDLSGGPLTKFNRRDGKKFLSETSLRKQTSRIGPNGSSRERKLIEENNADAEFYLTGESVIRAATIPKPPSSKVPTAVRVTHSNCFGFVDSDVYVRLGNPKKPLGVQDFDSASDWRRAKLVEDLVWDDRRDAWVLRTKKSGRGVMWSGTFETKIQFPKGHTLIEIKIISRVPEVCSIVLSGSKVFVR